MGALGRCLCESWSKRAAHGSVFGWLSHGTRKAAKPICFVFLGLFLQLYIPELHHDTAFVELGCASSGGECSKKVRRSPWLRAMMISSQLHRSTRCWH